jgi:hypothetical protein
METKVKHVFYDVGDQKRIDFCHERNVAYYADKVKRLKCKGCPCCVECNGREFK